MIVKSGINLCRFSMGVILLKSYFPKFADNIQFPASFGFSIVYKTVKGVFIGRFIDEYAPELLKLIIEAAQELEHEGVKANTVFCCFLAEITNAVNVTVFISSLIQVPLISRLLKYDQKFGVVVANSDALTEDHLKSIGIHVAPIMVTGIQLQKKFAEVILHGNTDDLDMAILDNKLIVVVQNMQDENTEEGAIVLECTDLSYFAPKLQKKFALTIFDLSSLTRTVAAVVERKIA